MDDQAPLEVEETREGTWVRVALRGELDVSSARVVRDRLGRHRKAGSNVRVDLSGLRFLDISGVHVICDALDDSRAHHCRVEVEPGMSSQARRVIDLCKAAGWDLGI